MNVQLLFGVSLKRSSKPVEVWIFSLCKRKDSFLSSPSGGSLIGTILHFHDENVHDDDSQGLRWLAVPHCVAYNLFLFCSLG